MNPYDSVVAAPSEWTDAEPGLREAAQRWGAAPRSGEDLVGPLQRPSLGAARRLLLTSLRLPFVQTGWMRLVAERRAETFGGLGPVEAMTRLIASYAFHTTAQSGPAGRNLVSLISGIAPQVADRGGAVTTQLPAPMPLDLVMRRSGTRLREYLDDVEDEPFASTEFDQMHRARLDGGREVVLVASRPAVAQSLVDDARLLAPWLVGIEVLDRSPWQHGLVDILRDMVAVGVRRCDQQAVALDAVVLASALERSQISDVCVARPLPELVNRRSAVYALPDGAALDPDRRPTGGAVISAGVAATIETGLVHGVIATHLDSAHLWVADAESTALVGGTTITQLSPRSRRAIAELLGAAPVPSEPVDALVALEALPAFADRSAVSDLLAESGLLDPLSLLSPGKRDARSAAVRDLIRVHGVRPTPELTIYALALCRLVGLARTAEHSAGLSGIAAQVLPRLAGVGARMIEAA